MELADATIQDLREVARKHLLEAGHVEELDRFPLIGVTFSQTLSSKWEDGMILTIVFGIASDPDQIDPSDEYSTSKLTFLAHILSMKGVEGWSIAGIGKQENTAHVQMSPVPKVQELPE